METVNKRIAFLIEHRCKGNKSAFARKIGITPAYAAQLYSSQREPSERTVSDICRVFGVNATWLKTGEGEPFLPLSWDEELSRIFATDTPKARLIQAVARIPDAAFPPLLEFLEELAKHLKDD